MQDTQQKGAHVSKLFSCTAIDLRDDYEERLERAYTNLQQQINGLNEEEIHKMLSQRVCDKKQLEKISMGYLYIMLTDPERAQRSYRDMALVSRNGINVIVLNLKRLVVEKYHRFSDVSRKQLLWLVRELIKYQVDNVENIIWNCLRQAGGGDVSQRNLFLVESLLDIFIEYKVWVESSTFLVQSAVFNYVRLIEDHSNPTLSVLRQKEVTFTISLIRKRFQDIIPLGRDFVRLLQNVARISEFENLWRDILYNPKVLHPTFNGIWQLLRTHTSRLFLQCRLLPEVEQRLYFFATSVKFGNQKRYQDWFQDKYFTTPESHSLRSDLIRFIINVIHTSDDTICSDIIPKWAIIEWLISSSTNPIATANAKLSLFYDWLVYDPRKDNIKNIEPGILLMYNSIEHQPFISSTLLDFLCRITKNFSLQNGDKIRMGVFNSLKEILDKQVIPSLQPLFESPKLDQELQNLIRETFREFVSPTVVQQTLHLPTHPIKVQFLKEEANQPKIQGAMYYEQPDTIGVETVHSLVLDDNKLAVKTYEDDGENDSEPAFSEDENEDDNDNFLLSTVSVKEKPNPEKVELPDEISESFDTFLIERDLDTWVEFLEEYRKLHDSTMDEAQLNYVISNTNLILRETLPKIMFPECKRVETILSKSISYPLFGLFRYMFENEYNNSNLFQTLLSAICERIPETGYLALYFMKAYIKLQTLKNSQQSYKFKRSVYRQICAATKAKVKNRLVRDLSLLEQENRIIYLWLIPDIYREFKTIAINNNELLRITLRCIDARNLRDLMYYVAQGKLTIFKQDRLIDCLRKSFEYETFEQFCLWQLVQAHDVPLEWIQDLIPELEGDSHPEALGYLLLLLKNEEPTNEITRLLLSRGGKSRSDSFVISALKFWCQRHEEKLSVIIASLLTSKYSTSSPNQFNQSPNSAPSAAQVLNHLEHYRRRCSHVTGTGLYVHGMMQAALRTAFTLSNEITKKQFSHLFLLAADEITTAVGRGGGQPVYKLYSNNSDIMKTICPSDENSSDEENIALAYKKRKIVSNWFQ